MTQVDKQALDDELPPEEIPFRVQNLMKCYGMP
ncbi:MAG: hypothetical protein [Edwardsiella phage MSW-3]|nr:MAG: hypothetical protein [Edwardsiella phage MSW-3]